jgi:hypothetical protein
VKERGKTKERGKRGKEGVGRKRGGNGRSCDGADLAGGGGSGRACSEGGGGTITRDRGREPLFNPPSKADFKVPCNNALNVPRPASKRLTSTSHLLASILGSSNGRTHLAGSLSLPLPTGSSLVPSFGSGLVDGLVSRCLLASLARHLSSGEKVGVRERGRSGRKSCSATRTTTNH